MRCIVYYPERNQGVVEKGARLVPVDIIDHVGPHQLDDIFRRCQNDFRGGRFMLPHSMYSGDILCFLGDNGSLEWWQCCSVGWYRMKDQSDMLTGLMIVNPKSEIMP